MKMVLCEWVSVCHDDYINKMFNIFGPPAGLWVPFVKHQINMANNVHHHVKRIRWFQDENDTRF